MDASSKPFSAAFTLPEMHAPIVTLLARMDPQKLGTTLATIVERHSDIAAFLADEKRVAAYLTVHLLLNHHSMSWEAPAPQFRPRLAPPKTEKTAGVAINMLHALVDLHWLALRGQDNTIHGHRIEPVTGAVDVYGVWLALTEKFHTKVSLMEKLVVPEVEMPMLINLRPNGMRQAIKGAKRRVRCMAGVLTAKRSRRGFGRVLAKATDDELRTIWHAYAVAVVAASDPDPSINEIEDVMRHVAPQSAYPTLRCDPLLPDAARRKRLRSILAALADLEDGRVGRAVPSRRKSTTAPTFALLAA